MKQYLAISSLIFLSSLQAEDSAEIDAENISAKSDDDFYSLFDEDIFKPENKTKIEKTQTYQQPQRSQIVNASPKKTTSSNINHLNFYGDLLYWKAFITDSTWAGLSQDTNSEYYTKTYDVDFNWELGFRVGLKFKTTWEQLIIDANWTRFYSSVAQSHQNLDTLASVAGAPQFFIYNNVFLDPLDSGFDNGKLWRIENDYKNEFDQFDLLLKKQIFCSKMYNLMPFMGVRGLILNHSEKILGTYDTYNNTAPSPGDPYDYVETKLKNNSNSVGLLAGVDNRLHLGKGWGINFAGDAYIGWGKNDIQSNYTFQDHASPTSLKFSDFKTYSHGPKCMIDVLAGFDWSRSFFNHNLDFMIGAFYEFHYIFNAPTFFYSRYSSDPYGRIQEQSSNFGFQGVTVRAGVGF